MRPVLIIVFAALSIVSCKNSEDKKPLDNSNKNEIPIQVSGDNQNDAISDAHLIIPGIQLGNIKLNTLATAVYDSLGRPTSGDAAMQKSLSTWDSGTNILTIFAANDPNTSEGHLIKLIRSTASDFKTKNGLGKGSSMTAIEKEFQLKKEGTFKEKDSEYALYSTQQGISFEFNSENICTGVVVHNPEIQAGITYLPIYQDYKSL